MSSDELKEKLGERQTRMVVKWLNENRIPWMKDRKGRPITTLSAIEKVLMREAEEEVAF